MYKQHMGSMVSSKGGPSPQTIRLADRDYLLVPINDEGAQSQQTRAQRSELQRYDSPNLDKVRVFEYNELPRNKKRIRLLQLQSGTTHGPEIFCQLLEADYDNSFHILTSTSQAPTNAPRPAQSAEERNNRLAEEWKRVKDSEIEYDALSWCWGQEPEEYAVMIQQGKETYKKKVKRELALALKYLRLPDQTRTMWIDAICINQESDEERNHQVQMMSRIYTRAREVCIWLGEDTDESKLAIDFIHRDIMELKNFDDISSDKEYTERWRALMMLMQREWFSRRWVVQELALASKAKIYCGPESIPWKEFAVAVELFVEVETATHRLSEVMQNDEKFRHVPGWFDYVAELGASLLVQATGKVFRAQRTPMDDGPGKIEDEDEAMKIMQSVHTIDPLDRKSLLSLEYLVSTLYIFNASESRDAIYSMLSIARDATPFAGTILGHRDPSSLTLSLFQSFLAEKPFLVDYSRPYPDVCRDFVEFCIKRKSKLDSAQALDILCRPWALEPAKKKSIRIGKDKSKRTWLGPKRAGEWKIHKCTARQYKENGMTKWRYDKSSEVRIDHRTTKEYVADILQESWKDGWGKPAGWEKVEMLFKRHPVVTSAKAAKRKPATSLTAKSNQAMMPDPEPEPTENLLLPSWVARASQAPFSLYAHPGMHILKTGRANADPLVGPPQDGHRNYSAAQTKSIDIETLRFKKRPKMNHYSLYVTGFKLDRVAVVMDASQGGNIPKSWLELGGWKEPYSTDPPDAFWRTIVADRGRDNRNPPYYYARACKESVLKGGIASGRVNTTALINNERNSIIAEFCRRVHAVIWGRSLFKTEAGVLGIATHVKVGDEVCILYGCTVPVILECHAKKEGDLEMEELEDQFEALRSCIRNCEKERARKAWYQEKKAKDPEAAKEITEETKRLKERMEEWKKEKDVASKKPSQGTQRQPVAKEPSRPARQPPRSRVDPPKPDPPKPDSPKTEAEEHKNEFGEYYVFGGECYLHGYMDGEALRRKFYDGIPDGVFELR